MPRGVGLTRERVIAAAAAIADDQGFEALTLTRLAAACGVRKPSLYKHVDGLPGVSEALAIRGYEALHAALDATPSTGDPATQLVGFGMRWWRFGLAHPGLYGAMSRSHVHLPAAGRVHAERLMARSLARLEELGLEGDAGLDAARALRALVHGFVRLEQAEGFGLDAPVERAVEGALRALVEGLLAQARA